MSDPSVTRLRVVGTSASSFTFGDVTITRDGTEVSPDQVEAIKEAARGAGAELEEV